MNTKRPTVFVVHESMNMNYSDAERFGNVRFVTNREWNPRRGSLSNNDTLKQMRAVLRDFNASTDYLILNGPPVLIGFAFHVVAEHAAPASGYFTAFKVLSWDKRACKYIEGLVELP